MRALLCLIAISPVAAADQLGCAIDGAGALDSTVNAGVYMWAATKRCVNNTATYHNIKCEIDVASAIQSVINMATIISGAVNKCDKDINTGHAACGQAVAGLASATAGLAAGSGRLAHWLQKKTPGGNIVADATTTKVGFCIVDAKAVASSIFQATAGIKAAMGVCKNDEGEVCATSALQVVSVLANLGSAIAHSVHHCSAKGNSTAAMSGDIIGLVSALDSVAEAGMAIDQKCHVPDSRLYAGIVQGQTNSWSQPMAMMLLGALLPMAAFLGYIGGRRQNPMSKQQVRDVERMGIISLGEEMIESQSEREP